MFGKEKNSFADLSFIHISYKNSYTRIQYSDKESQKKMSYLQEFRHYILRSVMGKLEAE